MTEPIYALLAPTYHQLGWPCVMPVPPETKSPPPVGFTGEEGYDTSAEQIGTWIHGGYSHYSIALRMPEGIIGIDVDHYAKGQVQKRGAETLAAAEARWGELPPTWSSTARGTGPSRIRFYRVPPGRYATVLQPDIEIIQRHHRYAVVGPSMHHDAGGPYRWYGPNGQQSFPPRPQDLPWLPESWVAGLREGASVAGPRSADHASGEALLAQLTADLRPACPVVGDAIDACARVLASPDTGTRHDAMTAKVHRLVLSAASGHTGLGLLLPGLREQWNELTAGEGREAEFERMLLTSARKGVTQRGNVTVLEDPCEAPGGPLWADIHMPKIDARPRPTDDREPRDYDDEDFEPLLSALPPKLVDPSWGQVLGTEPFDPGSDVDTVLAEAMLHRSWPMVRRASDMRSAWLLRGAELWGLEGDLAGRIVAETARLMPAGDPSKPPPGEAASPAQLQYRRRVRMMTAAPGAAVATVMRRLTDGGRHPATATVADLDTDPDILWAGGWPWDLRRGVEQPTVAQHVDPNMPHLMAAGIAPAPVPTPGWDRFVAAVWPDPEIRAWCLRVLSIAFTGHPDEALPVLFGAGGTGKTSMIGLLMELLGTYAHAANPKLLSDKADQFMTFQLKGRRLSFIDEAMREGARNAETLKQLTGGGELTGAKKNQDEISFRPSHTLVLTSNSAPSVSDEALRRRVRLLPCDGLPDDVRVARQALSRTWGAEAPGVLAMLMCEASRWLADRSSALPASAPLGVQFAMSSLVEDQDPVKQWLLDAVMPNDHGTPGRQLYVWFRGWCRDGGLRDSVIPTERDWRKALDDAGYPAVRRADANYRRLIVRTPGGAFPAPTPHSPGGSPSWETPGGTSVEPSGGDPTPTSTPQNPTSTTLFSPVVEVVEPLYKEEEEKEEKGVDVKSGASPHARPPAHAGAQGASIVAGQGLSGVVEVVPPSATTPGPVDLEPGVSAGQPIFAGVSAGQTGGAVEVPARPKGRARLTDAEKAERAAARKSAKAAEKAAERAAKVAELAGPTHTLPVVVDRAGRVVACSAADAAAIVAAGIRSDGGALTVDVETSGVPVGHREFALRTVQLGNAHFAAVLDPVSHAGEIRELLESAAILHAHSATADLVPLANAGLLPVDAAGYPSTAWARMVDSGILARLADPALVGGDTGLKALSAKLLGERSVAKAADEARAALFAAAGWLTDTEPDTPIERNGWAQVPSGCETMARYAASDVLDTALVVAEMPALPAGPGSTAAAILDRERATQRMTARLTHVGVPLDGAHVAAKTAEHTAARDADAAVLAQLGVGNPASPQQVAAAAAPLGASLPLTPAGKPSASKAALEALRGSQGDLGRLVETVLAHRHHATALKMFLVPYGVQLRDGDGRIRPTVYTLGTDTGRFATVRPNIQQLSREGGIRACIKVDPGQLLIGADFSGVELRVAAALSGDPELRQIIADGRDLHAEVAAMVFGPEWTKADRYNVKRMVFGRVYGGGIPTLAAQCGVSEAITASVVDSLDAMTPTLSAWSTEMRNFVKRGGRQFPTYSGRIIHLPGAFPHKAGNFAIQGTARELTVDAMLDWAQTPWGHCTMFAVHDEIDAFVPAEDAKTATEALVTCMTREINGVRIAAEASEPSPFWADSV